MPGTRPGADATVSNLLSVGQGGKRETLPKLTNPCISTDQDEENCQCYRKVLQGPGLVWVREGVLDKVNFEVRAAGFVEFPGLGEWE